MRVRLERGFTLIELMAVLALLTIIAIIAVPSINNIIGKAELDADKSTMSMIEKAANVAMASEEPVDAKSGGYSVKTLVDKGYLDYDYTKPEALRGITLPMNNGNFEYFTQNYIAGGGQKLLATGGITAGSSTTRTNNAAGHLVLKSGNTGYASGFGLEVIEPNDLKTGDTVTVSVKMKSNDTTDVPTLYIRSAKGGYQPLHGVMGKEFTTFYQVREWTAGEPLRVHFGLSGIKGTIEMKEFQIERGVKPTPWSPVTYK